jgi:lipoprotein-anchoring transpeptidase ErfK/SrfK
MITRRRFCSGGFIGVAGVLTGCTGVPSSRPLDIPLGHPDFKAIYNEYPGERYAIRGFDYRKINPLYLRQTVAYKGQEKPGTVVVDTTTRHLYFIEETDGATRYGVGVGREGFAWSGNARINMKRDWPDWVPPSEMVARSPEILVELQPTPRGLGVPGGPRSPLGARAMYLFGEAGDLGYRIHGTTEPETIGTNVSSGCIRMINQDIAHLYARVAIGTPVVVLV